MGFLFTMSADCLNGESTKWSYIENWQFSEDISVIGFPIFAYFNLWLNTTVTWFHQMCMKDQNHAALLGTKAKPMKISLVENYKTFFAGRATFINKKPNRWDEWIICISASCIDFKAFKTVYQFLADTGGAFING